MKDKKIYNISNDKEITYLCTRSISNICQSKQESVSILNGTTMYNWPSKEIK